MAAGGGSQPPSDSRSAGRDRGIGASPVSMPGDMPTSIPRSAGMGIPGGAPASKAAHHRSTPTAKAV
jgi:hypothetical protein